MLSKKITISAVSAAIVGASFCGADVFAANPYGINYSGGEPLGANNVQINPELVNGLTTLMGTTNVNVTYKSNKWKDGYTKISSVCQSIKYLEITNNSLIHASDGVGVTMSKDQYSAAVDFENITLENIGNDEKVMVGVRPDLSWIYGGWMAYSDAECTQEVNGATTLTAQDGDRLFVEMNIKLYRDGTEGVFTANDLYFGITDIDASQSYKILNSGNEFSYSTTFAKSVEAIQNSEDTESNLKNMYVTSDKYIYSQFDSTTGDPVIKNGGSDVYVKLNKNTQMQGLDLVFGFARSAASSIEYYAQQYNVTYASDENGEISGITEEKIISGSYPSGSTTTPNDDYELAYWVADVDVTLQDGTTIRAGEPITSEQIEEVIVDKDINFTAIHKEPAPIEVPDTGISTGEMNAVVVPAFMAGAILGTVFLIRFLNRFDYKKVDFKK